ncbi:MAG: CPBP family intramembrane metalloprotease [Clostridia bacterium]|jgi:membrane protease YdiL (CAAX protease family)|nr:CPBP family intramembrane metalloprotease [Clostridia bacterium]
MKLKAKQIIIRTIAAIAILVGLSSIYLFLSGIVPYEGTQIEGVPSISLEVQIVLLSCLTVINILNLILVQKLIKHKKLLIALNIIQMLFGGIVHIIGGIIAMVLLFIDTKDVVEEPKEPLKLPELEKIEVKKKWIYFLLWIFLFAIFYSGLIPMPFLLNIPPIFRMFLLYGIQALILGYLLRKDIKRDFLTFKGNFKTYMKYIFPKLGIFFIVYIIISVPIALIAGQISTNQAQLNELPLVLTATMAILFAPILEEFMFRGLLRKSIPNDIIFMIISGLIFGAAHMLYAEENLLMYIYIIPYTLLGYFLARSYAKTNNIFTNISIHFFWNTFAIILNTVIQLIGA